MNLYNISNSIYLNDFQVYKVINMRLQRSWRVGLFLGIVLVGNCNYRKMNKKVWGFSKGEIKELDLKFKLDRKEYRRRLIYKVKEMSE